MGGCGKVICGCACPEVHACCLWWVQHDQCTQWIDPTVCIHDCTHIMCDCARVRSGVWECDVCVLAQQRRSPCGSENRLNFRMQETAEKYATLCVKWVMQDLGIQPIPIASITETGALLSGLLADYRSQSASNPLKFLSVFERGTFFPARTI